MTMEEGCGCCAKKRGQYELHQNLVQRIYVLSKALSYFIAN